MTQGRVDPLLDETWTRVDHFQKSGPSARSCPVDAMEVDEEEEEGESEWEYEDTEELVTLDLGPESKRLLQMSHQFSITGLETNQPFMRLGNVIFKGQWDQILGTEIILRDQRDAGQSSSSSFQRDIRPLPTTQTDLRTGRAPGTTRHRIQFRPAVNMVAREQALRGQDKPSSSSSSYIPTITHKGGWVWMRGRGWMRKEQIGAILEERLEEGEKERGGEEGGEASNGDVVGDGTIPHSEETTTSKATAPKKKLGRQKMTSEERMRFSIWKSLQKVDERNRASNGVEEDEEEEDESGGEASSANESGDESQAQTKEVS